MRKTKNTMNRARKSELKKILSGDNTFFNVYDYEGMKKKALAERGYEKLANALNTIDNKTYHKLIDELGIKN